MTNQEQHHTQLLFDAILDRPDGDILNIVQAARELNGDALTRLSAAYFEVTRAPLTPAEEAEDIGIQCKHSLLVGQPDGTVKCAGCDAINPRPEEPDCPHRLRDEDGVTCLDCGWRVS